MKSILRHVFPVACLLMLNALPAVHAQDGKVLGVELGTRFLVPACNAGETAFPSRMCMSESATIRKAWGAQEHFVFLPVGGAPPYVRGEIRVAVVDGIVEAVHIGTWGIQSQGIALDALSKKYGTPTRTRQEKQNALRSRFPTQFAEWELKDFSVKLEGTTGSIDWGRIEVTSHRYRKLVAEYEKQRPAKP